MDFSSVTSFFSSMWTIFSELLPPELLWTFSAFLILGAVVLLIKLIGLIMEALPFI